jgi:hypothetical protein
MPYFPLIVVFCQRYVTKAGIGTLVAMMLPYSVVFMVAWSAFLLLYWALGIPLGIQASYTTPQSHQAVQQPGRAHAGLGQAQRGELPAGLGVALRDLWHAAARVEVVDPGPQRRDSSAQSSSVPCSQAAPSSPAAPACGVILGRSPALRSSRRPRAGAGWSPGRRS